MSSSPHIEQKFRGIGQGWARTLYGGSTGGWESLAVQIFYPDEYNGTWTFCPDPIDFRAYSLVDIYSHKNAYFSDGRWKRTPRPGFQNEIGEVLSTNEEMNHLELVLGTNARSGYQYDIWQAVFGPVGDDGYPKPIWDKRTGVIDRDVAAYWREHYDLRYILERDWKTLGPKLKGKIHIYTGDMDNWYLHNAVYLMEAFLKSTKDPYYDGDRGIRGPPASLLVRREGAFAPRLDADDQPALRPRDGRPHHQDGPSGRGRRQLALLGEYRVLGSVLRSPAL